MSKENKRFYWLKLKEDFFTDKRIKRLRKISGGDTYTVIYLKLLLLSLSENGRLYYDGVESDFISELALTIDEGEDDVMVTVNYLITRGLLEEVRENDEYFLTEMPSLVGSETASTRRSRKHREKKLIEKNKTLALQCNTNATPTQQIETKRNTEKEKELDIEKEKDIELDSSFIHSNESSVVYLFPIEDGSTYPITTNNIELLEEKYPTLALHHEFMLMANWLKQDEKRLKPADYMPKFIDNWLSQSLENKNKGRRY